MFKDELSDSKNNCFHCPGCDKQSTILGTLSLWMHGHQMVGAYALCPDCKRKLNSSDSKIWRELGERLEERLTLHPDRYFLCDTLLAEICWHTGIDLSPFLSHLRLGSTATEDDARWFKANPHRTHRLRPALPSEEKEFFDRSQPPGAQPWVVLRNIGLEQCARLPLYIPAEAAGFFDYGSRFEPVAAALFSLWTETLHAGGITFEQFFLRLLRLSPVGERAH